MAKQRALSLTADGCEPVKIEIISARENRRTVDASFGLFSERTLYVVADESIEAGTTVSVEHNDLTITGEVVRCEQGKDLEWTMGISLRYISTKMESLLRMRDVLARYDSAFSREGVPVASENRAAF